MSEEHGARRRFPRIASHHTVLAKKSGSDGLEEFGRTKSMAVGGCSFVADEPFGVAAARRRGRRRPTEFTKYRFVRRRHQPLSRRPPLSLHIQRRRWRAAAAAAGDGGAARSRRARRRSRRVARVRQANRRRLDERW